MVAVDRRARVRSEAGIMSRPNQDARDAEVEQLRSRWPSEWRDGARLAFLQIPEGQREAGDYPAGFHTWELSRRNAWFSGYTRGFLDRLALEEGKG
jgi:hypothetical protein